MLSVFEYTDYRKFLSERLSECKTADSGFTYRYIAKELGFSSPGYITQIIQNKSNVSTVMIPKIAKLINLQKREALYFGLMVNYNQATVHEEKRAFFKRMIGFKKGRAKTLEPDEFEYYDRWYYSAIRAIFNYYRFDGDYQKLAAMVIPKISALEAKKTVAVLVKLKLLKQDADGNFSLTNNHITSGLNTDSVVINNFVLNTLDIAKDALYRFHKDDRSLSALTLSVSPQGYERLKKRIDDFRAELIAIVANDTAMDRVCQVNFQLFPLTEVRQEAKIP